jgi:hypothetical protein
VQLLGKPAVPALRTPPPTQPPHKALGRAR